MTATGGSDVFLGARSPRGIVAIDDQVEAGRYNVTVVCRTLRKKRYRLIVTSVRPTTGPAQLSGR